MTESGDEGEVVVHDTEVSFLETNILQTIRITSCCARHRG